MKRPINACALSIALLLSGVGTPCFAVNAAPAATAESEQVTQLLDQLGVRSLIEQTPAILAVAIEAETQFLGSKPQPANWRRELEAQLKAPLVLQNVIQFLRGHYRADTFARAQQRLQEPIAKRARYFDLAMTQPGAEKNLRDFLRQNASAQNAEKNPADNAADTRRNLLRDIDNANYSSRLMAALQSAIAARVREAAGSGAMDSALLQDEIAERQRYLQPLAVDYLLYDYRYLRDDELNDYRDLLRDDSVQWLLDICYQAIIAAIAGEQAASATQLAPHR